MVVEMTTLKQSQPAPAKTPAMPWIKYRHYKSTGSSSTSTSSSGGGGGCGSGGGMNGSSGELIELPIWVGGCQKWVTGLTTRTTCDDVIYALLAHENNTNDEVDIQCYAIYERWRDVERPLKGRTKILKVWRAWGSDRHSVRFSVRKITGVLDTSCEVSRAKRTRKPHHAKERDRSKRSRDKHRSRSSPEEPSARSSSSRAEQTAEVAPDMYKAHAFHELVQLILEQERKMQEQVMRVNETDTQIENYETKMHMLRIKENGQNYVQEAYLRDKSEESSSSGEELFPAIKANDLEAYVHMCDNILELESKIEQEQSRIMNLSVAIQNGTFEQMVQGDTATGQSTSGTDDAKLLHEIRQLRHEVERSEALGRAQQHQMKLVAQTVEECEFQMQRKHAFIHSLVGEISHLESLEAAGDGATRTDNQVVTFDQVLTPAMTPAKSMPNLAHTGYADSACAAPWSNHPVRSSDIPSAPPALPPPTYYLSSQNSSPTDSSRKDSGIDDDTCDNDVLEMVDQLKTMSIRNRYRRRSGSASRARTSSTTAPPLSGAALESPRRSSSLSRDVAQPSWRGNTVTSSSRGQTPESPRPPLPPRVAPPLKDLDYYVTKVNGYRDYHGNRPSYSDNDSTSDTGLSSLHSEDTPPALETLV